jgi:hypothetical protein
MRGSSTRGGGKEFMAPSHAAKWVMSDPDAAAPTRRGVLLGIHTQKKAIFVPKKAIFVPRLLGQRHFSK